MYGAMSFGVVLCVSDIETVETFKFSRLLQNLPPKSVKPILSSSVTSVNECMS